MRRVFESRDKLMLRPKSDRQRALPDGFPAMLATGCEAYGSFEGEEMRAFCIFFPWRDLPMSTLVLMQSVPVPGVVDLGKNGLAPCLDSALDHMERRGYAHVVFRRAADARWRPERILRNAGRLAGYAFSHLEMIPAGAASRWPGINDNVLDRRPVEQETAIVTASRL